MTHSCRAGSARVITTTTAAAKKKRNDSNPNLPLNRSPLPQGHPPPAYLTTLLNLRLQAIRQPLRGLGHRRRRQSPRHTQHQGRRAVLVLIAPLTTPSTRVAQQRIVDRTSGRVANAGGLARQGVQAHFGIMSWECAHASFLACSVALAGIQTRCAAHRIARAGRCCRIRRCCLCWFLELLPLLQAVSVRRWCSTLISVRQARIGECTRLVYGAEMHFRQLGHGPTSF